MVNRTDAAAALAVALIGAGLASGGRAGAEGGAAAAQACANPNLPPSILAGPAAKRSADPLRTVEVRAPGERLRLAVADDNKNRELGLMCVTRLRPGAGMIFVFPASSDWSFWMKNTLVPLDMIWVEADGKVSTVEAKVPRSTLDTPDGQVATRRGHGLFVIELRAGEALAAKIGPGTKLTVPPLHALQ